MKHSIKAVGIILLAFSIIFLSGCTENKENIEDDDSSKFVGTWKSTERDREYTFFSNGTYFLQAYTEGSGTWTAKGTYEIKDGEFVIYGLAVGPFTYSFSDNDNTLTLIDVDDSDSEIYTKQ